MISILSVIVFWTSAVILAYTWLIFPLLLFIMMKLPFKKNMEPDSFVLQGNYRPAVSVIVAAYNEEKYIAKKIENLLAQDYSPELMEIIVASDGSSDNTVEIARRYESGSVKIIEFKINRGKASIHNDISAMASGEILFYTDVETILENDFISKGLQWFQIEKYGCGSGDLSFSYEDDIGKTENIYWRMEKALRYWEFKLDILPFVSGACLFVRKKLFEPIPAFGDTDNLLPLATIVRGYHVFYAKKIKSYDSAIQGAKSLFKKRVRTTLRSIRDMYSYVRDLYGARKINILLVLFSHRILRWHTGILLILIFLANLVLLQSPGFVYKITFVLQAVFYWLVIVGWRNDVNKVNDMTNKIGKMFYSFFLANIASALAILKLMAGKRIVTWKNY